MNPEKLRQLIASCRNKTRRFVGRPPGRPSDWCPHRIQNPEMPPGFMFSDASAWEFIATKLESGHSYTMIVLDVPQGADALVMQIPFPGSSVPLYVKVEVGSGCMAIGRSFHFSYQKGNASESN